MSQALQRSIGSFIKPISAIKVQDSAAQAINGAAQDRVGFASCVVFAASGDATGAPTAQAVDVKLQDSADGTTGWTDIAGAAVATLAADDSAAEIDVDLSSARQFVRAVAIVAFTGGTAPTIPVAVSLIMGGAAELPQ